MEKRGNIFLENYAYLVKKKVIILVLTFSCFNLLDSFSQKEILETEYKRSSLYSLILTDSIRKHEKIIVDTFLNSEIPIKFNDHNLDKRIIKRPIYKRESISDQKGFLNKIKVSYKKISGSAKRDRIEFFKETIIDYFSKNKIPNKIIAKWFNRSKKGEFDLDLIFERGFYNSSSIDVEIAKNSARGMNLLTDAGEELIAKTFVIVNDFEFISKEDLAKEFGKVLDYAKVSANQKGKEGNGVDVVRLGSAAAAKGYVVKTTSFLFKLRWNEETASSFYLKLWNTKEFYNKERIEKFNNSDIFHLDYIGYQIGWADVQSTIFSEKSNDELIAIATIRAFNNVIAKLQRKYDVFKTKTPLINTDPIAAKIGVKEGVTEKTKFEVLEQVLNKDGIIKYKRIGQISPIEGEIWDNDYVLNDEKKSEKSYTTFKVIGLSSSKRLYPGLLIRQIKN
jgi:hypothetical protein